ncbi:MAG: PH domain-containing protein [Phycisphaerae bacterium]
MITTRRTEPRKDCCLAAQSESTPGGAVGYTVEEMVPAHLLDGGEVVHFAIKPSAWFVLLTSLRWMVIAGCLAGLATTSLVGPSYGGYLFQLAILVAGGRLAWATIDWVSRLYVLTNRRVMSIRGVFSVELYECSLDRIQDTRLTLSPAERLARVGTVTFQTASGGGSGFWRIVSRPLEVHEKLRDAIRRARNCGGHCV